MSSELRRLRIAVPAAAAAVLIMTVIISVSSEQLPPSGTYPDFNFGAAGDWGDNSNSRDTARNMADHGVGLAILLGDLSYGSDSSEISSWWEKDIAPLHGISVAALGNHDDISPAMMNQYHGLFGLAEKDPNNDWIYSFNYKNIHFLAMNTQASESQGSMQYDFAKDDLATAASNPDIKWIVVFFHKPMYTSRSEHEPEGDLQDNFHPLFDRYGVDLVLYGHNHNYQRTFPLMYNPADPSSPIIETTEKTKYKDLAGEVYVNVGTGGESHYPLENQAPFVEAQDDNSYGFIDIDIMNGGRTMKGTFYTNENIALDTFTIEKPSDLTNESQRATKQIVITEVELSSVNGTQWIEVHNPTDDQISLATMHINGSDGHELQITTGMSDLLPQNHVLIRLQPDDSYPLWSNTNNTITIYQNDPNLEASGMVGNVTLWDRTPQLTDTFIDKRTWQLNGTKWVFVEATPMTGIPEFSSSIAVVIGAISITVIVSASMKYLGPKK